MRSLLILLLFITPAFADSPVVFSGNSAKFLPSALKSVGVCTLDAGGVLASVAPGSSGNVLTSNGSAWVSSAAVSSGVTTVGTIDSQTKSANGLVISGANIYAQNADATYPGLMSTGTQTIAGAKTFSSAITGSITGNSGTATALAANPAACSANQFVNDTAANGDLTCAQPTVSNLAALTASKALETTAGGVITTSAYAPATNANTASSVVARDASGNFSAGTITASLVGAVTGNASTATALAANPTDCGAGTKATAIDASGNLTCSAVALGTDTSGTITSSQIAAWAVGSAAIAPRAVTTSQVAIGGITNTEVNSAAAIAYSKLNLATSIVNADISASAAIADSKLAQITTAGKVSTSSITGTHYPVNGGTGVTSLTANNVILGAGTAAVTFVAPGASGNVLKSNGTTWTSAAPASGSTSYVTTISGTTTRALVSFRLSAPSGGTCAVEAEFDNAVSGTPTSGGTGQCDVTFTTTWASDPICECKVIGGTNQSCIMNGAPTTTTMGTYTTSTAGSATNERVTVFCYGAK